MVNDGSRTSYSTQISVWNFFPGGGSVDDVSNICFTDYALNRIGP